MHHKSSPVIAPLHPELSALRHRLSLGMDERRPAAVEHRSRRNQRTARENVEDLLDNGSFIEYGALAIAAQRKRRTVEDLIARTPANGLIAGMGTVNASQFGEKRPRCMVMAYDYTVIAGTQGYFNHKKMDRRLGIANEHRLPLILFYRILADM